MVKVKRKVLRDDVYEVVLDRLMSGMYKPNEQLGIDQLARELGVSQTPVREAMVELEHTGLVSRAALKGYRVAEPLSSEQIAEIIDVRVLLEVAASERAFDNLDDLMPELESAFAEHESVGRELARKHGDQLDLAAVRPYFDADWAFHQAILNHCGNPYLARAVEDLTFNVHRMRQSVGLGETDSAAAIEEHRAIVEAYQLMSPTRVRAAMEAHMNGVLKRSLSGE